MAILAHSGSRLSFRRGNSWIWTEITDKPINRQNAEVKQCPNCLVSCHRIRDTDKRMTCLNCKSNGGASCEFCWDCLHAWKGKGDNICGNPSCNYNSKLFQILAECPTKKLLGIECPSLRACPKCFRIIEHIKHCKHMTCKRCRHEFCFMCLEVHKWRSQSKELCQIAPRQTSGISEFNESKSKCVIM